MLLLQAHLGMRQAGLRLWISCLNPMFTPQLKCTEEELRASGQWTPMHACLFLPLDGTTCLGCRGPHL